MIIILSANKKYTLSRFQLYARSAASYLIETWNTRWITSWTPPKTSREERSRLGRLKPEKNNRSLEKRPYPIWFCPGSYFQGSADQESYQRNENFSSFQRKHAKSDNSDKRSFCEMWRILCRLDFCCCWSGVRTTNTHNIVLYAKIWLAGRKTF